MLISNSSPNLFKPTLYITQKDIKVDESFLPIDKNLFEHTGIFESGDRGDYEVCVIKAGSQVWATLMPNNMYYILDSEKSSVVHASCKKADLIISNNNGLKPKF